jgi:hypothetical protein
MNETEALLDRLYDAFNNQDLDTLLASMHPEVDWPNYLEGGRTPTGPGSLPSSARRRSDQHLHPA